MQKDWKGNKASVFTTLGASNYCDYEREKHDYYATEPLATELLCELENFQHEIWEPACGEGHISKVMLKHGYNVKSTDLIDRGFGDVENFLMPKNKTWGGDIVTNPPYKFAQQFIEKALSVVQDGAKVAMFLKLTFLEGKSRKLLFATTPRQRFTYRQAG